MRLNPAHPALSEHRTIHTKMRKDPLATKLIFKSVKNNGKMGKGKGLILRGRWKGMPLYSLTLEERDTCPSDCIRWAECYGNGSMFAHRYEKGVDLESKIMRDIATLNRKHPKGFVVRLHVLGDFYSTHYVKVWECALSWFPTLHIYGYTARHEGDIHNAILGLNANYWDRCRIRISRDGTYDSSTPEKIYAGTSTDLSEAFICPEQTGKVNSCLDCALCWEVDKTVVFLEHDEVNKAKKAKEAAG